MYNQLVPSREAICSIPAGSDGDTLRDLDIPTAYLLAAGDRELAAPGTELAARVGATPVRTKHC